MVSKEQLYKDLDAIAEYSNSVYFNFVDLTTKNLTPFSNFDFTDYFRKTKNLLGPNYKKILVDEGLVSVDKNKINFIYCGTAADGGGISYTFDKGEAKGKGLFLFYNAKTRSQKHTAYHEAAHALQNKQNLFNSNKLSLIYNFLSSGVKDIDSDKVLAAGLVKSSTYSKYLCEAHSEAFATACMMMRSNSDREYRKQKRFSLFRAHLANYKGLTTRNKEYPSFKFYSTLPTQKAVINTIDYYKKNGKIKQFYDNNGNIDFPKLSKEVEKIVLANAYSPKEFTKVLDKDIVGKNFFKVSPKKYAYYGVLKISRNFFGVKQSIKNMTLDRRQRLSFLVGCIKSFSKKHKEKIKEQQFFSNKPSVIPPTVSKINSLRSLLYNKENNKLFSLQNAEKRKAENKYPASRFNKAVMASRKDKCI